MGRPAWAILGGVALLHLLHLALRDAALPAWLLVAPLLASVVLVGLPHGALDHLVVPWLRGERPRASLVAGIVAAYLALVGAVLAAWFAAPGAAVLCFLLLTWAHWGQGELWVLVAVYGARHLDRRPRRAAALALRGALPIVVPLLAHPGAYLDGARDLAALFGAPDAVPGIAVMPPPARATGTVLLAALAATALWPGLRRRTARDAAWRRDAAEVAGLALFFAVVPPALAIGSYFVVWHSWRHVARLLVTAPRGPALLRARRAGTLARRLARDAVPTSAAALAIGVGLALLVPDATTSSRTLAALYLVLLAALTVPHTAVVALMDRAQRVWSPACGAGAASNGAVRGTAAKTPASR